MRHLHLATIAMALLGCNEPPGAPVVEIGPEGATTVDTLTATLLSEADDPNKNDDVTYTYSWTVDSGTTDVTGTEVTPDRTRVGQTWTVTVTPSDGKLVGIPASASITIANSLPTATASIAPTAPLSTEDLVLTIGTADLDGDTVNTTVSWTKDGANASISSPRVPADRTRPGQIWEATVVPRDARGAGEPAKASVQIENQAPVVESVIIRPGVAFEASRLEAVPDATDPDSDPVTWTYDWHVNGVAQGPGTDNMIDGESFDRGDTITVVVVANDGLVDSAPMESEAITVANTPPSVGRVTVSPTEAYEDTTLSCVAEGWADDDGDPEDYRYSWTVDGVVIGSGKTVDGAAFNKRDRVVCEVFPFDGIDEGRSAASRPVTIQNTAPALADIEISPEDPESGTDITATVGTTSDLDDDVVTVDVDWYVAGRKVASGATLPAGSYIKDQEIYAEGTPNDGDTDGPTVKSNTVTAVNAAPTITSFAMTPVPLLSRDTAGVSIATDDWDGDTVTVRYTWTINGEAYGDSSTTSIPSSDTTKGDVVAVTVQTNDGEVDGDSDSDSQTVKLYIAPPEIAFDPPSPEDTDDVYCKITKDSVDSDGGKITYYFSWEVDGVEYKGTTTDTEHSGDTVPSSATADDEEWTCKVYASSPNGASTVATLTVTVGGLETWSFTDKTGDDVDSDSLYDFFDGLSGYTTSWYILFEVDSGTTNGGAWCAENAKWYIDNYVTYASGRTTLTSPTHKKWAHGNGGSFSDSSVTTTGYSNYFGSGCDGRAYSWCSNWGISTSGSGSKSLAVMPGNTTQESYASAWRSSDWDVKIQVAPSRKLACGF